MSKAQFIYRYGVPVTVTRNDNTTYQTKMLYRRANFSSGTFNQSYMLSTEYMRMGIFKPTDDIADGYIVTINSTNEEMFISAVMPQDYLDREQSIVAEMVLLSFPTQVTLTISQASASVTRDKFGRPTTPSATKTIGIIVTKSDVMIVPDVGGGKPVNYLEFYTMNGAAHENDEIAWNGHMFRITSAWPFGFADTSRMLYCRAQMEIDS